MSKQDLRCVKTEGLILKAFQHCVKESGFEKLKVSDICAHAQISRNTFYKHYEDKYNLLDQLFLTLKLQYLQRLEEGLIDEVRKDHLRNAVKWYLDVTEENSDLFTVLMDCAPEKFIDTLKQAIVHSPMRLFIDQYDTKSEDIPVKLNLEYMLYGMIGYTKSWLKYKDQISKADAIDQLDTLCREAVHAYKQKLH